MNFLTLAERLARPEPPWLYRADLVAEAQTLQVDLGTPPELTIVCFDSATMTTLDDFFDVVASRLSFPDYFGHNWPAFDECLADAHEWLSVGALVLLFVNSEELLSRDRADLPTLFTVLVKVGIELARETSEGEPWDRPSVAFHAVFDVGIETRLEGRELPLLSM
ncbi:barstar family protein [Nonomuraea longicatena]|uniref:Barstar (barnase inhibitor) domain-containing protein n=1 Tax=Nonomuraea longicatena TaxID=83682 RepID=A0ABP4BVZ3_9ACTN